MKKWKIFLSVCATAVMLSAPAHAVLKKVGQTGLQFLKIDMSTRGAAMGGSYTTVNNDATSMFYNPAGLAAMESDVDIFVTNTQWFAGISYLGGGAAVNLGNWGTVGLSWLTSDYGDDFIGTQYDPRASNPGGYIETGKLGVGAWTVGLSYAKALTNKFTVGGQIKSCYQHLGETYTYWDTVGATPGKRVVNEVKGLAYDFGTIFYPGFKSFRIGMTIRNFSAEYKYVEEGFELPLTFVIGAAMDVLDFMGAHDDALLVSVDAVHPRDYTERIHLGAEYTLMKRVSVRVGYKFNYDNEGFTAGIGLQQEIGGVSVNIGYAYARMQYFDAIHRISIGASY